MLARVKGATRFGVEARLVDVESDVSPVGTFKVHLAGLPAAAARGMERRVFSALRNAGFAVPGAVTTVNFAPAALPKEGPPLDLAVAVSILASSSDALREACAGTLFFGELSLDARVRPVAGALAAAEAARGAGLRRVLCAPDVAGEAAAVAGLEVFPVGDLREAVDLLRGGEAAPVPAAPAPTVRRPAGEPDLADVRGQRAARRALEIAAAGGHGLLLVGPPGSGKSLLARRLPSLLPPLTLEEAVEVTRIHSAAGLLLGQAGGPPGAAASGGTSAGGLVSRRPFRAPHHGISMAGLLGGGPIPGPGEITLAHHGVLFLDEVAEFRRDVLEALRQPLEDGAVSIVRVGGRALLPARFMPCAAMNPCPCGWSGSRRRACACSPMQVARYRARLSGPLLDRLDLHVDVPALAFAEIHAAQPGEASASVRERVVAAREIQQARQGCPNAALSPAALRRVVRLADEGRSLLQHAVDKLGLSGRAHDRVLQVALTISDLAGARGKPPVTLGPAAVGEALAYRRLDRRETHVAVAEGGP